MDKGRFLYKNLITSPAMITVSSLRAGVVTAALKDGTGSAVLTPSGNFSGSEDLEYIVEIDSIAGGAEVGQATFKWSDGGGNWDATGVITSNVGTLLNNGVYIAFATGSGADFVLGDKWNFKGINIFNIAKMLDFDRDSHYRSADLDTPNTITINLGSPQEFNSLIIMDHNFSSAAVITLEADAAATFDSGAGGAPQFSEPVEWATEKILHYLSVAVTKQYGRLKVSDAANPDRYIEVGELFLGSYLELTKNYYKGFSEETKFLINTNSTPFGIDRDCFYNSRLSFSFDFKLIPIADVTSMKTLVAAIISRTAGTFKPFWFNKNSAELNNFWLVKLASLPVKHNEVAYYDMSLILKEVVKSI